MRMSGNEVNEAIDNLCNKLGVASRELIVAEARYHIAQDVTALILLILIGLAISYWVYRMSKRKTEMSRKL